MNRYSYEEIDSTNAEAKRLAVAGAAHGTVVTARRQTAGRGRSGHSWNSQKDAGAYFSILLRPDFAPERAATLTLVAAVAVARAIGLLTGERPQVKWPNDILLSGKKVCGILVELDAKDNQINDMVVGIGVNLRPEAISPDLEEMATCLGGDATAEAVIDAVLEEFEPCYEAYVRAADFTPFLQEYEDCLVNKDKLVRVLDPNGAYEGIARGITPRGELLVEREDGMVAVDSGEVSVRGIYGYAV